GIIPGSKIWERRPSLPASLARTLQARMGGAPRSCSQVFGGEAMFASSFLAGPRLVALGAVLTFFLPLTSPRVANGLSNEWSYAAPSRQSGKFIDKTQGKTPQPVRALTEDAKARVRNAVPAVGLVMAEIGDQRKLAYRGSAVVVRSDGIVVTNHHV